MADMDIASNWYIKKNTYTEQMKNQANKEYIQKFIFSVLRFS